MMNFSKLFKEKMGKRRIVLLALMAVVLSVSLYYLFSFILKSTDEATYILISEQADNGPITFRGAMVDGRWYNPFDICVSCDGWEFDAVQNTYTSTDNRAFRLELPFGRDRILVFNTGSEEGTAVVEFDRERLIFDLYNEYYSETGTGFQVPADSPDGLPLYTMPLTAVLCLIAFIVL